VVFCGNVQPGLEMRRLSEGWPRLRELLSASSVNGESGQLAPAWPGEKWGSDSTRSHNRDKVTMQLARAM
jgi:hypothetical protein